MEDRIRRIGDYQLAHLHMACNGCGVYVSARKLRLGLCPSCYSKSAAAIQAKTKGNQGHSDASEFQTAPENNQKGDEHAVPKV